MGGGDETKGLDACGEERSEGQDLAEGVDFGVEVGVHGGGWTECSIGGRGEEGEEEEKRVRERRGKRRKGRGEKRESERKRKRKRR